jgi:hypothetical protein
MHALSSSGEWQCRQHENDARKTDAPARCMAGRHVRACALRLPRSRPGLAAAVRAVDAFHFADCDAAAAVAFTSEKRAQSVEARAGWGALVNQVQNKYFGDRSTPGNECCDRWTLVVSSDPALLATLHWVADDHFVGPRLESVLSELLHDAELI